MLTEKSDCSSFEQFRSNTCHKLKDLDDLPFITQLLESNQIRTYYEKKWYPESLYLLAMLDHLSTLNGISLCSSYNDLRSAKLIQLSTLPRSSCCVSYCIRIPRKRRPSVKQSRNSCGSIS